MVNVGVIGCGYWGINYVRVFGELADSKVCLACDASVDRVQSVQDRFQLVGTTTDWRDVLSDKRVDAVVVATPATSHFEITHECLLAGKHVLVEKPMTTTVVDGERLVAAAQEQGRILMVGHTFLYNTGIRKVKEIVSDERFGRIYYMHATRTNMGPIRSDVNAIWDLAAHDVSIFNYLLDRTPASVSAVASRVLEHDWEDVAFATLKYAEGVLANVHVSWVDPNKVREVVVVGSQCRVVFDDLNNLERVRVFEKGVSSMPMEADTFGEFRLLVRDGDIVSPRVDAAEPLKNLGAHFLECIVQGREPLSGGRDGLDVVKVMAAIDSSLAQDGVPMEVG